MVSVGRVGRPHGLAGAFFVEDASEAPERLAAGANVYVGGEPATIVESKRSAGRPVIRLDRPVLRGAVLEVPRAKLPPTPDDSYYVFELVGLTVHEEGGGAVGRVQEVDPGIANDVLVLDSGLALPLVDACVRTIDLEKGVVIIAPGFVHGR
ncbi:MAG: 16S rRNA processing protein RimM [Thermoleophilia bacterium]|nr:16S rRNA processing protein RimM [Thermoleophilia bacterium]